MTHTDNLGEKLGELMMNGVPFDPSPMDDLPRLIERCLGLLQQCHRADRADLLRGVVRKANELLGMGGRAR